MFEFLALLLALPLLWWAIIFCFFAVAVFATEYESATLLLMGLIVLAVGAWWFTGYNLALVMWANKMAILFWSACYLAIGVSWSFFKYNLFARDRRREYDEYVLSYAKYSDKEREYKSIPKVSDFEPVAMQNKRKFYNWIVLWWASMFWYFCSELIKEIVDFCVRHLSTVYDKIARRHFADLHTK
jgi:hypothetical protein